MFFKYQKLEIQLQQKFYLSFGIFTSNLILLYLIYLILPYFEDAGTFSPYEHGEVYVLDDGGEVDLDLGNYERFLNVSLSKDNNITTGRTHYLIDCQFFMIKYFTIWLIDWSNFISSNCFELEKLI